MRERCIVGVYLSKQTSMDLSNDIPDEQLWDLILKCDVPMLKSLLSKAKIPTSNTRKDSLQMRLYYAVRLGLHVASTEEEKDKERNDARMAKLEINPGFSVPHPLLLDDWDESMSNMPNTNTERIREYYASSNLDQGIDTAGYKALKDGRSISLSDGRVTNVSYHHISPVVGLCFVKGQVVPQTRVHDKPYLVWSLIFKSTGVVYKSDCHCTAGLSGICKHVAALLYKISDAVEHGKNRACTSTLQAWHQPSKKLCTSAFMTDIATPKATPSMSVSKIHGRRDEFDPRPCDQRKTKTLADYNLDELAEITNGKAAILSYASNFREEQSLSAVPDVSVIGDQMEVLTSNEIITTTINDAFQRNPQNISSSMKELQISEMSQEWIADMTTKQSSCDTWFEYRNARITASTMGDVIKHVDENNNITGSTHSIVAKIMSYYPKMVNIPNSIAWGRQNEGKALNHYDNLLIKKHKCWKRRNTGLWISVEQPVIAASPDSLVDCNCCGAGVVEVKCPWTDRNLTVTEYAADPKHPIIKKDGSIHINKQHPYYSQIQAQMFCTKREYCDLVTFTNAKKDFLNVTRVHYDQSYAAAMISKALVFWSKVIVNEIKTGVVKKTIKSK